MQTLREDIVEANKKLQDANDSTRLRVADMLEKDQLKARADRATLLSQMTALITANAEAHEARIITGLATVSKSVERTSCDLDKSHISHLAALDEWRQKSDTIVAGISAVRDCTKKKLKTDYAVSG